MASGKIRKSLSGEPPGWDLNLVPSKYKAGVSVLIYYAK
jgi:hypothetical protein